MQSGDVRMTALKLLKLTAVPHPPSVARAGNLFIAYSVAKLVVQHGPDPPHRRRLERVCDEPPLPRRTALRAGRINPSRTGRLDFSDSSGSSVDDVFRPGFTGRWRAARLATAAGGDDYRDRVAQ